MLEKYYSPYQFCIGGYSEECICFNEDNSQWIISRFERGQIEIIGEYSNILDGCLAYIEANSSGDEEIQELKDIFITNLFS
jgi:hypothetical protein